MSPTRCCNFGGISCLLHMHACVHPLVNLMPERTQIMILHKQKQALKMYGGISMHAGLLPRDCSNWKVYFTAHSQQYLFMHAWRDADL